MLRIGLLTDSEEVPAWVLQIIQELSQHKYIQWVVTVRLPASQLSKTSNPIFRLFSKIDHALLPGETDWTVPAALKLPVQITEIELRTTGGSGELGSLNELEAISRQSPDLLLCFASGPFSFHSELYSLPRLGIWTLQHGGELYGERLVGFWEWYKKSPVTEVRIVQMKEFSNEMISQASTRTNTVSFSRNRTTAFARGIELMVNTVNSLANKGILPPLPVPTQLNNQESPEYPSTWTSLGAVTGFMSRSLTKAVGRLFFIEQWSLLYTPAAFDGTLDPKNMKDLTPGKDRIWADPFVVSQSNKYFVFMEELMTKSNKGHISCIVLNENLQVESIQTVLEKPYHLSYPFVFQHKEKWYLVPESAENKTVDLYECVEFPNRWAYKRTLLDDIQAFDSTIHYHNGNFWLSCTIQKKGGASSDDDLYLFSSIDPIEGEWSPHPANPVISDPYRARPAGRIFEFEGHLCRPSQICVPRYGYGLSLNRVTQLDETSYREEPITSFFPDWRHTILATHTLNFTKGILLIDALVRRPRFW